MKTFFQSDTYPQIRRLTLKKHYNKALALTERLNDTVKASFMVQLLVAYVSLQVGRNAIARRAADAASNLEPKSMRLMMVMAYLDLLHGNEKEALLKYTHLMTDFAYEKQIKWILSRLRRMSVRRFIMRYPCRKFLFAEKELFEKPAALRSMRSAFFKNPFVVWQDHPFKASMVSLLVLGSVLSLYVGVMNRHILQHFLQERVPALLFWESSPSSMEMDFFMNEFSSKEKKLLREVLQPLPETQQNQTNLQTYTTKAALRRYEAIQYFIHQNKINSALIVYNQMMASSISFVYKEKFKILRASVPKPNFHTFENTLRLSYLLTNQYAMNTYVKWRGVFSAKRSYETYWLFSILEGEAIVYTAKVFFQEPLLEVIPRKQYLLLGQNKGMQQNQLVIKGLVVQAIQKAL